MTKPRSTSAPKAPVVQSPDGNRPLLTMLQSKYEYRNYKFLLSDNNNTFIYFIYKKRISFRQNLERINTAGKGHLHCICLLRDLHELRPSIPAELIVAA